MDQTFEVKITPDHINVVLGPHHVASFATQATLDALRVKGTAYTVEDIQRWVAYLERQGAVELYYQLENISPYHHRTKFINVTRKIERIKNDGERLIWGRLGV